MKNNKYQSGIIYFLRSHQTEDVYIDCTTQPLDKRFNEHKKKNIVSNISSEEIMKYDDAYIELIENYPCNSKDELNQRKGWYFSRLRQPWLWKKYLTFYII